MVTAEVLTLERDREKLQLRLAEIGLCAECTQVFLDYLEEPVQGRTHYHGSAKDVSPSLTAWLESGE